LHTLIESSRDGIVLVSIEGRMLVVNAPALNLLNLSGTPVEWTDRPIADALGHLARQAPTSAQQLGTEMSRIRVGDEPPSQGEFEVFSKAIKWSSLPVLAEDVPLGRLLVLHDVTEERLLARLRDDLTHMVVHDLRNPLTGISVALNLLDTKLIDQITPAQHRLFEIAADSTAKMIELVNSILDLGRLEKGQLPLDREPLSLAEVVDEVLRLQSPLSAARDLRLECDVPNGLPPAWADRDLTARILQNLIGNAIKFTPAGGSISVAIQRLNGTAGQEGGFLSGGDGELCVTVSDDGPGIAPELRKRLFRKFVVGEHEERGSGLGLAFCRLAVEAQGGRIWAESAPGEGATFAFTLPVSTPGVVA
jgi:signal transduction histidine kinase